MVTEIRPTQREAGMSIVGGEGGRVSYWKARVKEAGSKEPGEGV